MYTTRLKSLIKKLSEKEKLPFLINEWEKKSWNLDKKLY